MELNAEETLGFPKAEQNKVFWVFLLKKTIQTISNINYEWDLLNFDLRKLNLIYISKKKAYLNF